ncbi:MAG: COQ9 family protein [Rickettsiales bacterium]|nr:COQ9 family protein [Rickettsiales bacterium]|tara:strand:+ start:1101 stop:1694 length:594 start_codon:yes stop_codon:yes gene_type:complete
MKKNKIDKKKFLFKLLENFSSSSNLDAAILTSLSQMKISKDKINDVKSEILPNGFKSLMIEVNQLINERIRSEKLPKNFKNFRTHEKVIFFVMRRLEIFNEILDKYKFFRETLRPFVFLNTSKTLFQIADEIWFLSGDKSTDYNYYTKRFLLMKIYALTFSFFIFDRSEKFQNTRKFLDKQIELILGFGKLKKKLKS